MKFGYAGFNFFINFSFTMSIIDESFNPTEHLKRLNNGCFLFATKILTDPNFASTVVLLCQHSPEGSYGLVLNRLSHMPLSEIFNSIELGRDQIKKVHIGGPVQESELQILHITQHPVQEAIEVVPGVYLGGYWDNINAIINSESKNLRLFLGYSGWGKGQLESEIMLGGWEVLRGDVKKVLSLDEEPWGNSLSEFKKGYCHL
jgi:putative transcriptional regulator